MATNTFYLRIVSAKKVFFSGRCISIIVPVADGQEEILAHHENMVNAVENGELKFKPEGADKYRGKRKSRRTIATKAKYA